MAMNDNLARVPACLSTLAVMALVMFAPRAALAQQRLGAPPGKGSFTRYCASCHGVDGKGDGPLANLLTPKPTDLTLLAKKNNGTFPVARVTRIIDGSEQIPAHGTREMPVWGHKFGAAEEAAGGQPTQTVGRERIQLLLEYLNKIQEK
jgi:mono/diheme cytochrome c family protein